MNAEIHSSMEGKDYERAIEGAIERILQSVAIAVEGDAITRVPVDTGRLKCSITYATVTDRDSVRGPAKSGDAVSRPRDKHTAHVGTNVEYAAHVEYGTRHSKKQPYLRPALHANRAYARQIAHDEIAKALKAGSETANSDLYMWY